MFPQFKLAHFIFYTYNEAGLALASVLTSSLSRVVRLAQGLQVLIAIK